MRTDVRESPDVAKIDRKANDGQKEFGFLGREEARTINNPFQKGGKPQMLLETANQLN
jgi:hypothetical protein